MVAALAWPGAKFEDSVPRRQDLRLVPVFPELLPHLTAVYDELLESFDPKQQRLSEQAVITRYRDRNSNLRVPLHRIIERAGLTPWPKTFSEPNEHAANRAG